MLLSSQISPRVRNYLLQLSTSNKTRKLFVSLAIAKVFGDTSVMPTEKINSPEDFYITALRPRIAKHINAINETLVIDTTAILDLSLKFFKYRYNQFVGTSDLHTLCKDQAIASTFGLLKVFSKEQLKEIEENYMEFTEAYSSFCQLICELDAVEPVAEAA